MDPGRLGETHFHTGVSNDTNDGGLPSVQGCIIHATEAGCGLSQGSVQPSYPNWEKHFFLGYGFVHRHVETGGRGQVVCL